VVFNARLGRFTPEKEIWYLWYRRLKGPVWMGAENLASTGIRYPSSPARSELKFYNTYGVFFVRFAAGIKTQKNFTIL
jgi:hypothetical protein